MERNRDRNGTGRLTSKRPARDRVELTGLRPSALPHHRTYGFPYPAVGQVGGLMSAARSDGTRKP